MWRTIIVAILLPWLGLSIAAPANEASSDEPLQSIKLSPTIKSTPLTQVTETIPLDIIRPFLTLSRFIPVKDTVNVPYVLGFNSNGLAASIETHIYVYGLSTKKSSQFAIFRRAEPVVDPQTHRVLGYTMTYLGRASLVQGGAPTVLRITEARHPILERDWVLPYMPVTDKLEFIPKRPKQWVDGRIIDNVDSGATTSLYRVISINRGAKSGLRPGDILDIEDLPKIVPTVDKSPRPTRNRKSLMVEKELPGEQIGKIMIFKVYEELSFAVVLVTRHEIPDHARVTSAQIL